MSAKLHEIAHSSWFKNTIIIVICLAAVLVGFETYPGIMQRYRTLLYTLNFIVIAIFVVEIAIRVGAYGRHPGLFFRDPWNVFDFVIVAICLLPFHSSYVAVLRLARVLRVLRLVTAIPQLKILVGALLKSIPSIGYITIFLTIHFYIYACIGTFLFSGNDPLHFGSLHKAMITLFQVATLENWTDVYYLQLYGSHNWSFDSIAINATEPMARPIAATIYFVTFILFGTMIILNLFIGVILNGMSEMQREEELRKLAEERAQENLSPVDEVHLLMSEMDSVKSQLEILRVKLSTH